MIQHRLRQLTAVDHSQLIVPQLNLNGTSKRELIKLWLEGGTKLQAAIDALRRADLINGRDYLPQGGDSWRQAVRQHHARLEKLQAVFGEIEFIIDAIHDQNTGHE